MKIRCIILDDEPLARKVLERFIAQVPQLELVKSLGDSASTYTLLQKTPVDLLFLDIKMPGLNGLNLLRMLPDPPAVIFVTAFPEYAVEGFELEAIDYLLKPFSFDRFLQSIRRVEQQRTKAIQRDQNKLLIRADKKWYPIAYQDILYIQAYGDYVKIFLSQEMLISKDKLSRLYQEELPPDLFFRVHRSYIVYTPAISYMEGNQVIIGTHRIPIGQNQKEALLEHLGRSF